MDNLRCQVAVVGAGHAGIEAALACARMGMDTILFTINLDAVANLPCNPSIGGTGKGHLVFEIDALGGEMGRAADRVTLQSRTLNLGKGAAVHSKRIQADRTLYRSVMKQTLEHTEKLRLIQAEVTDLVTECTDSASGKMRVLGVVTALGETYTADAVILATGTFLNAEIFIGDRVFSAGPDGMLPATGLTEALRRLGLPTLRFKTGTPARVHRRSIDFSRLELQEGEHEVVPFSFDTPEYSLDGRADVPCHIVYTNQNTHRIILDNLERCAMYSGNITGQGPRYCPSIETKLVRFADKERHQLFIEPCGRDTEEMYIQGFSTSMPTDVQRDMLHSLDGFENAEIMRFAYAIEYDLIDPTSLYPTLEFKAVERLYGAGQFNGTSGYEEAGAQGLVAGINAALKLKGEEPLILPRSSSYIGTLIDDLVTKGTNEPYRIMTSRSEYRLLLRQDNADARLSEYGYRVGLLPEERYARFKAKQERIETEIARLEAVNIPPSDEVNALLAAYGSTPIKTGVKLAELMRRPELGYEALRPIDRTRPAYFEDGVTDGMTRAVRTSVEIRVKYKGYIERECAEVERQRRMESLRLPEDIDYAAITGLRLESAEKLAHIRPQSIGQASRISGVNPADISVLLIYLEARKQK